MFPITQKGQELLKEKLLLLQKEAKEIPAIIGEAREKGDLKENAEYHAARERQGLVQAEITKINSDLQSSKLIEIETLPKDTITFGKKVTLLNQQNNQKEIYKIMGPAEAFLFEDSLAINSIVAKGILGKKKGDSVTIQVPSGEKKYQIVNIEYID